MSGTARLLMLAFDHRSSFAREVLGADGEPGVKEAARIRDAKLAVFGGLAAAAGPGGIRAGDLGVLVDEQYGSAIPPLARELGLTVAVAVERSGRRAFEFEYGERFAEHIEAIDPDLAKVLVRLTRTATRRPTRHSSRACAGSATTSRSSAGGSCSSSWFRRRTPSRTRAMGTHCNTRTSCAPS
jgi:Uncharacterized protein conserved in bacteria (DUF2090)